MDAITLSGLKLQKSQKELVQVRVLILGTGPAGLTAALYAARADLKPVILTGTTHGGQVSLTYTVENYPGFPEGISGVDLVEQFQKQAENFGAELVMDTATSVDLSTRPFRVSTYNTDYLADSLIITTGATARHLEVPGERELTGRGVSYCATCDGWFFKNKDIVVVGGGDSAIEEALFLTRFASSVTIVHRRDELRAGALLQKRAMENPKIHFIWNTVITEILGEDSVRSIRTQNVATGETGEIATNGVFVFIGHTPNTELFSGQLDMDPAGYLITDRLMRTSIHGVFAAGEAADPIYKQVITSAGMGAAAAIQANHYLDEISEELDTVKNPSP